MGVTRYAQGGGSIAYTGYNSANGVFEPELQTKATLRRTPLSGAATGYFLHNVDGSALAYTRSESAENGTRRMFLTSIADPQGNRLTLSYDSLARLTAITDGAGRFTRFSYNGSSRLVTGITDPFNRTASLTYENGNLTSIRDVIGIVSSFGYGANGLSSLTTPYGTDELSLR